jgi:hypothetical protein
MTMYMGKAPSAQKLSGTRDKPIAIARNTKKRSPWLNAQGVMLPLAAE